LIENQSLGFLKKILAQNVGKFVKMRNLIDTQFWGYFGKKFSLMMNIKPFALSSVLWLLHWE